jgi:excisionase family DNA binding protein
MSANTLRPGTSSAAAGVVAPARRAFFTPKALAAYLSLSERTIREMLRTGVIPSYRIEGARRVDPRDVDSYLAARRREAA